jgi:hypothetical protein
LPFVGADPAVDTAQRHGYTDDVTPYSRLVVY